MRFFHLADLHLGKALCGVSLLEKGDQRRWAEQLILRAEELRPDAILIAGDVYDRSAPSGEAMQLLSRMLTALSELNIPVLLTAGNHDSAARLSYLRSLLSRQGVHISAPLSDSPELARVTLEDEHGPVTFWLMPYAYPALVAHALGEDGFPDYDAAVRALLARQDVDFTRRNVLVAHQNVTAFGAEAARGGSESMVGGVGQVEYTAFDGFDYVALGHIHAACPVGRNEVRYAGSPLCYHFDELRQQKKGALVVELGAKGAPVSIETLHIPPLHPLREIRGSYDEIRESELQNPRTGEYLRVALTDRRISPEVSDFLRALFRARDSVLMELVSEYDPYTGAASAPSARAVEEKPVEALFADFFADRSGADPDDGDLALLARAGELLRRADAHTPPTADDVRALLDALHGEEDAP